MRNWFDIHLTDSRWGKSEDNPTQLRVKGPVYWDDAPCTNENLNHRLSQAQTTNDLTRSLNRLNGFYAWVEQTPGRIRAAVDHIRSRPLFYASLGGRFLLSDDAEWVRQQVGDREMDPVAREEFQLAGYVTGTETLFPNVKQLQAGEVLVATQQDEGVRVEPHRYYRFLHTEPDQVDEPTLRARLDQVAVASIQRLIDYANGRQIVAPLSGGYDSRLIVTLLKRLGYDNVLTFTYGVPGNKESAYSKRVADALGLRWHFVEYSEALWREAWQTPERWDYQKWASGWNSIAHVQDWLAVKIMKEQGILEKNAIFAPGHCCVTGLIPSHIFTRDQLALDEFVRDLSRQHFSLAPHELFELSKKGGIFKYTKRFAPNQPVFSPNEYTRSFMEYGWQERQAKFICNSVRVYEFFGYDWWMPLWDMEFMGFWEGVPLELRKGREWYKNYVSGQFSLQSVDDQSLHLTNAADPTGPLSLLINSQLGVFAKRIGFLRVVGRKALGAQKRKSNLGWAGWYTPEQYADFQQKGISINGMLAVSFITEGDVP